MLYYGLSILEAAAATVLEMMFWHCYRQNCYTLAEAKHWTQHRRLAAVSFAVQLAGLWMLTAAAQIAGMSAGYPRRMCLLPFLWLMTLTDWHDKIIPNRVVLTAAVLRLLLLGAEVWYAPDLVLEQVIFMAGGAGLMAVMMLLCYALTRGSLGAGDVKLFILIGAYCGANSAINILLFSMLLLAAVSLMGLALRKVTLKSMMPMAPFVFGGFLLFYLCDLLGEMGV